MKARAQNILLGARIALQDEEGVRWPLAELIGYLNDGQRALMQLRPGEYAHTVTAPAQPGSRQTLPDDAAQLLEVRCNSEGRMLSLTLVERKTLEAVAPRWEGGRQADVCVHYMHSPLEPRVFYVYPPASSQARFEMTYARYPADVPTPPSGQLADVAQDADAELRWENALRHYVLYRAWAKDAEFANSATLSAAHYQLFTGELGVAQSPSAGASRS